MIDRLFRERLDALSDPLDPGFGFDLIRLSASRTEIVVQQQRDLDANVHDNDELAALIDRIAARIGGQARGRAPAAGHPYSGARGAGGAGAASSCRCGCTAVWPARVEGEPPLRPLRLFERPEQIKVIAQVPDGPPASSPGGAPPMRWFAPKAPSASPWNGGDAEGEMLTRDYFRVEDEAGLRFWLYRDGLYDREIVQEEGKAVHAELVHARTVRMNSCGIPTMPRSASPRNFSFLRGGSHPQEYVHQASDCGLPAIGIADRNTLAGVVRAYRNWKIRSVEYKPQTADRLASRLSSTARRTSWPIRATAPPMAGSASLLTRGKRGGRGEGRMSSALR